MDVWWAQAAKFPERFHPRRTILPLRSRFCRWIRPEQAELLAFFGNRRLHPPGVALVRIVDAVFCAQACHQLGKPLAVGRREERALLEALAITCHQVREFLFEE